MPALNRFQTVWYAAGSAPLVQLAAKEIARYVYLRTRRLPRVAPHAEGDVPPDGVWVGLADDAQRRQLAPTSTAALGAQGYRLIVEETPANASITVLGGDAIGALYGAYRLAEHMGSRFYLHGDVVADPDPDFVLPTLDETEKPLFELRGLNPWGSHAEGIDLWNADDYKALIAQMTKMRMNFIGIHSYPEAPVSPYPYGAEPIVWTGLAGDVAADGTVARAYKASFVNAMRDGWWGLSAKPTGHYSFGGRLLFERDDWGPDVMRGLAPEPTDEPAQVELFNRTGEMFREAFNLAKSLGVKTALGTETPLIIPKALQEKLQADGRDPRDPEVTFDLYVGMFERLKRAHPLDFYWIWTPEAWTWAGASDKVVERTLADVNLAIKAAEAARVPFGLATAGWVLGPPQDRTLFHRALPKDIAVAEIARMFGCWPIDENFGAISGRAKWAIPWLEGDPALSSPQLWVGRVRRDAIDARVYGCTGLMGLHWRTKVMAPNAAALAQAGWRQGDWLRPPPPEADEGAFGGAHRALQPQQYQGLAPIYRTLRLDVREYRIAAPAGLLKLTLHFIEPMFAKAGARAFDVFVQGEKRIAALDCYAESGVHKPVVRRLDGIVAADGIVTIEFRSRDSIPLVAGIELEGDDWSVRINCGGPATGDFLADWPDAADAPDRHAISSDFWDDWARAEFGAEAGARAAPLFERLDGRFPVTSDWLRGAGGIIADPRNWSEASRDFSFVPEFEALDAIVQGPPARSRFAYWREVFRYGRAQGRVRCALGVFEAAMAKVAEAPTDHRAGVALDVAAPAYADLLDSTREAYEALLASVSTPGCIGNLMNWEGHIWTDLIDKTGQALAEALGSPLPPHLLPSQTYRGGPRLIVPTVRSLLQAGEDLTVRAIVLDEAPAIAVTLNVRALGEGDYRRVDFTRLGRGVFSASISAAAFDGSLEYYVEAECAGAERLAFPPGAPDMGQTVVVWEGGA